MTTATRSGAPATPTWDRKLDHMDEIRKDDPVWEWTDAELKAAWDEADAAITHLGTRIDARLEEYTHFRSGEKGFGEEDNEPNLLNRHPCKMTIAIFAGWVGRRMMVGLEQMRREANPAVTPYGKRG